MSRLFGARQSVDIVVSDTCLVMMQDILHSNVSVTDYLHRRYPEEILRKESDPALRSALELIAARHYTSLADSNIASKLWGLSQQFANSRAFDSLRARSEYRRLRQRQFCFDWQPARHSVGTAIRAAVELRAGRR